MDPNTKSYLSQLHDSSLTEVTENKCETISAILVIIAKDCQKIVSKLCRFWNRMSPTTSVKDEL